MYSENQILCPHCKHEHNDIWEFIGLEEFNVDFDMQCEDCEKWFRINQSTTINFITTKM